MNDYRIIISPRAGTDLKRIYDHIARNSPANAATVIQRLLDALDNLKELPHRTMLQRPSHRIRHPVRSLPIPPYVVFFRAIDDDRVVRILTVRHGAQRRPRRFD